ncbi:hypothetical protein [Mycoplana sp. BE70]|uniref:hypothetical protein n=1 Tax=Mycoplana sp. BE70 TaxID=2817775 RepID=UPI003862170E
MKGCVVAVQGLGHVGAELTRMLHAAGAKLIIADISKQRLDALVAVTDAKRRCMSMISLVRTPTSLLPAHWVPS